MTSLSKFFFGRPSRFEQIPTVTPQQQNILNQLLEGLQGPLGAGVQNLQQLLSGAPEAFEAFQAPARRSFFEQTVPQIAERFTGADAQRSSAFGQRLGQAGASLEENLAAQRAGLQSQALSQLQNLLGTGLRPQFATTQIPGQTGFLQNLLSSLGQVGGAVGTTALGGGLSGLLAGQGFRPGIQRSFGF
jgi:hypothetical protein